MSTSHPPSPHIPPLDALSSFDHHHLPMGQQKPHNSLSIVLPSPYISLRGTGVNVDPCVLRGSVVLEILESTAFKEITLQFRGKARLANAQGERQAGRHVFPFTLQIEDWLPSTLSAHSGLAGISYKLRATAVRPGFSSNLHAACPVQLLRSFPPESLEYQQTLELENTWPEKLMYAIMVPHKAWAAGDTLCALVKFSPLNKGIRITGITTSLHEHVKTFGKAGSTHDETRVVCSVKHEIQNGRAFVVPYFSVASTLRWTQHSQTQSPFTTGASTPSVSDGTRTPFFEPVNSFALNGPNVHRTSLDVPDVVRSSRDTSEDASSPTSTSLRSRSNSAQNSSGPSSSFTTGVSGDIIDLGEQEIVTTLELPLPSTLTPSHALEPILISHRLRWNIILSNPDGHVSELRCSLPIHILDYCLLDDARAATRVTRRLLFGLEDVRDEGDEIQLPSYPSHVMDRVPDDEEQAAAALATSGTGPPTPLDYVNMQLMSEASRTTSPSESRIASRASSRAPSPERRERGHHSFFSSLKPFTKVTSSFGTSRQGGGSSLSHSDSNSNGTTMNEPSSSSLSLTLSPRASTSATQPGSIPSTPNLSQPSTPPSSHTPPSRNISRPILTLNSVSQNNSPRMISATLPNAADDEVTLLSRVPQYEIASRGFLGGIMPISSLRGLPSYEEASRLSRTAATSPVPLDEESPSLSRSLGRNISALHGSDLSRGSAAERSLSDGDLAGRFANAMGLTQRR
ncbi:hypothetical protein Clacol_000621 [Clathrus columnatus]|uniref:Arrestin C-terminal-like domain-containing protein n=1 Tax=Clathrus columnatus TaxID=1419009 RepID=A0AAV5A132_9AGAM|nr:hypothetical protein Clacol_000621 [Clathrus columnatus]